MLRNDMSAACQQYGTLLAVSEAIVSHRDLTKLFHANQVAVAVENALAFDEIEALGQD